MVDASHDPVISLSRARREFGEYGGVNASIEVSSTFTALEPEVMRKIFNGEKGPSQGCYLYGRSFNPTVLALSRQLAAMEGTEAAYCTASGMAAVSSALMAICNAGDHIVASNTVYGGTHALLSTFFPKKTGVSTTFVNISDKAAVEAAICESTKVIYTETISNPTLVVADLPKLASIAHRHGLKLVVDNTFAPLIVTPSRWGADVVLHSMTKYISGASDVIAGAICSTKSFIQSLMDLNSGPVMLLGPTMDPKVASEISLRLPHLALRIQEHSRRAQFYAEGLQSMGAKVIYPGLSTNPWRHLLNEIMNPGYGFGGILGVDMGSANRAEMLMQRLQNKHSFGLIAVSLGYFDTLMSLSGSSTSSEMTASEKTESGISPGYVRMSVGITGSLEQRWLQLKEAYEFVQHVGDQAPYRAVMVKRGEDGQVHELLSWPTMGTELSRCAEGSESDSGDDGVFPSAEDQQSLFAPASLEKAPGDMPLRMPEEPHCPSHKAQRLTSGARVHTCVHPYGSSDDEAVPHIIYERNNMHSGPAA